MTPPKESLGSLEAVKDAAKYLGSSQHSAPCGDDDSARLERLILDIIADHGICTKEVRDLTRKELHRLYGRPEVGHLESVLRKRITEDEARHILLFPDEDHAAYYQVLIAKPPKGAPPEHPQCVLQIPHLSLLYLQHWKKWEFVSAFVLAGGLHTLCSLLADDNVYIRLHAVHILVNITAHRDFDWFRPPPRRRGGGAIESRLHRALLGLSSDPAFIPGLIANSRGTSVAGKTFPGGCLMSLELLAMWLSWVRALHTVDGTLRLSRPLLRAIQDWGGKEGGRAGGWGQEPSVLPKSSQQPSPEQSKEGGAEDGVGVFIDSTTVKGGGKEDAEELVLKQGGVSLTSNAEEDERKGNMGDDVLMVEDAISAVMGANGNASGCSKNTAVIQQSKESREKLTVVPLVEDEAAALEHDVMTKEECEERAGVEKLVEKLVADFSRFPPAEEEWGDLRKIAEEEDKETDTSSPKGRDDPKSATPSGTAVPCGKMTVAPPRRRTEDGDEHARVDDSGRGDRDGSDYSGGGELSASEGDDRNRCSAQVKNDATDEALSRAPIRKAEALKAAGNEAFYEERFEAADEAFSAALDLLYAHALPLPSPPSPLPLPETPPKAIKPIADAQCLRGILHRNRAAVALRLVGCASKYPRVESMATTTRDDGNKTSGAINGCETDDSVVDVQDLQGLKRGSGTGEGHGRAAPSDRQGGKRSTLALLERCESDCLSAIELDALDKKAHFRLARCREMRRRCCKGEVAASVQGEGAEHKETRQQKKAELMDKILARMDGSHEILGGTGDGGTDSKPFATTAAASGGLPARKRSSNKSLTVGRDDEYDVPSRGGTDKPEASGTDASGERQEERGAIGACARRCDERTAPREGGELKKDAAQKTITESAPAVIPLAGRAHRTPPSVSTASPAIGSRGRGVTGKKMKKNPSNTRRNAESSIRQPTEGTTTASNTGIAHAAAAATTPRKKGPFPGPSASRVRSLRRRLEHLTVCAATTTQARKEAARCSEGEGGEDVKMAADFLLSLPTERDSPSLKKLFGDGIMEESLVGVARALCYACGGDATVTAGEGEGGGRGRNINAERVCQLFLELGRVNRVSLASAMCSPSDKSTLRAVSEHVRRHCHLQDENGDFGCGRLVDEDRRAAFEAAVLALGL